jgi:hypothetical protein
MMFSISGAKAVLAMSMAGLLGPAVHAGVVARSCSARPYKSNVSILNTLRHSLSKIPYQGIIVSVSRRDQQRPPRDGHVRRGRVRAGRPAQLPGLGLQHPWRRHRICTRRPSLLRSVGSRHAEQRLYCHPSGNSGRLCLQQRGYRKGFPGVCSDRHSASVLFLAKSQPSA